MGMLRVMSLTSIDRACPLFLFCSCVYFCLYCLFKCTSFHKFSRQLSAFSFCSSSPQVHLHVVRMLRFMSDVNQPSLPTPFYYVLVSISVYGSINCTLFHEFSRQLSDFWLCSSCLIFVLFVLSSIYHFVRVSFIADIIHSGWLGSKHQLTNKLSKSVSYVTYHGNSA